jgi:hypothetical protein
MKPICVPCRRFYRPRKNNFFFVEAMPDSGDVLPGLAEIERWKPYKLWAGDLWECDGCGAQIISGVAREPIREHYQPDFESVRMQLGADFQINDC